MKHAIMVMGFGDDASVLQETINVLDDEDIDFIIHWDKRFNLPELHSNKSNIIFIPRIRVNWATDLQTRAEILLFKYVYNSDTHYDYCHLISANDIPLMDANYFKDFFKAGSHYLGFVDYLEKDFIERMKYYYPIRHLDVKWKKGKYLNIVRHINKLFKVNRLKNKHIEKGCNWFSMDVKYLKKLTNLDNFNMFKHTFASDEFYVQTILYYLKPDNYTKKYNYLSDTERMNRSSRMALRYIDWHRGDPYVFSGDDVSELKRKKNTKYAFVRKVYDHNVCKQLFFQD